MARYLVELYFSRAGSDGLAAAAARARSAAETVVLEGHSVRWLRTIFVPEDETCFYLYEADTAELVRRAGARAESSSSEFSRRPSSTCRQTAARPSQYSEKGVHRVEAALQAAFDSACNVGEFASVTVGADGLGLISYLDRTNGGSCS